MHPTLFPPRASRSDRRLIMRVTQGCFSFLPDLTDEQIAAQVQYCLEKGWAVNIEFTDDPHPRNTYWEMWGLPMFDLRDAAGIMRELADCRRVYGDRYIRICGFDASLAGSWFVSPSSSTGRSRSPASGSTGRRRLAGTRAIRRVPMLRSGLKASDTRDDQGRGSRLASRRRSTPSICGGSSRPSRSHRCWSSLIGS